MTAGWRSTSARRPPATSAPTVIFDVGLTLLKPNPSFMGVFAAGARRAGVTITPDGRRAELLFSHTWRCHDQEWRAAGHPSPMVGDRDVEERFWQQLYRRLLTVLGVGGNRPEIARRIHQTFLEPGSWETYREVEDVLDRLGRDGAHLGVVSNWGPTLRELLTVKALADRFDTIVVSGEEGVAKPDPDIFERALDRLGRPAGTPTTYVGDDLCHDVVPARRLGLATVLVDRAGRHPAHDGPRVATLRSLPALVMR